MLSASGDVAVASTVLLPHVTHSVVEARRAVAADLRAKGCPREVVDDVVLVVSEVLSNALKHARPLPSGKVRVSWAVTTTDVGVEVTDGGSPTRPRLTTPSTSATGGRGLGIVRDLTSDWGVVEDDAHTTVWAAVPQSGTARGRHAFAR